MKSVLTTIKHLLKPFPLASCILLSLCLSLPARPDTTPMLAAQAQMLLNLVSEYPGISTKSLDSSRFLFGEEFEYWVLDDQITNTPQSPEANYQAANKLVHEWKKKLKLHLAKMNIPETEYELEVEPVFIRLFFPFKAELHIRIGNWKCKVFPDFWFQKGLGGGYALLEVTPAPYQLNQRYTVGDKVYSSYEMMDHFITEIASELQTENRLTPSSGHKHIDTTGPFSGNLQLLFRFLLDIENKSWLSQAFATGHDSRDSFYYISQGQDSPGKQENIILFADLFNQQMIKKQSAINYFARFWRLLLSYHNDTDSEASLAHQEKRDFYQELTMFKELWKANFQGYQDIDWTFNLTNPARFVPAELRFYRDNGATDYNSDYQRALSGEVINHPSGTLELRFFNTARSGHEARLINQMLVAWIKKLHADQLAFRQVNYVAYDPAGTDKYSQQQVLGMFNAFIYSLGLKPEDYSLLFRARSSVQPDEL